MPPTTHRRKLTQKELKAPDEFTTLVDSARDFLVNNLNQVLISAGVVALVGAIVIGVYYYERHRDNLASAQLLQCDHGAQRAARTRMPKRSSSSSPMTSRGAGSDVSSRFYLASAYIADGDLPNARDSLVCVFSRGA